MMPLVPANCFVKLQLMGQSEISLKWEAQESLARLYEDEIAIDARRQYRLSLATLESARSSLHEEELNTAFSRNCRPPSR